MKKVFIRVSKTGYMKGWGSKWVGGLSPVERTMIRRGHIVIVINGVPRVRGLDNFRVVKFYGRYGYCPRLIAPRYRALAKKAIRFSKRYDNKLLGRQCSKDIQAVPF